MSEDESTLLSHTGSDRSIAYANNTCPQHPVHDIYYYYYYVMFYYAIMAARHTVQYTKIYSHTYLVSEWEQARLTTYKSHARMVVRECCKGGDESQWERGIFDPHSLKTP